MHSPGRRDDFGDGATAPGAIDPRVRVDDAETAQLARRALAAQRHHRDLFPRHDVRERVLQRPPLAFRIREGRPAETRWMQPLDDMVERAVLLLDARDDGVLAMPHALHAARLIRARAHGVFATIRMVK